MAFLARRFAGLPFGLSRYRVDQLAVGALVAVVLLLLPLIDKNASHISAFADAGHPIIPTVIKPTTHHLRKW